MDNDSYPNEKSVFYQSSETVCVKVVTGWNLAKHKRTKKCMATLALDHLVPKTGMEPLQPVKLG